MALPLLTAVLRPVLRVATKIAQLQAARLSWCTFRILRSLAVPLSATATTTLFALQPIFLLTLSKSPPEKIPKHAPLFICQPPAFLPQVLAILPFLPTFSLRPTILEYFQILSHPGSLSLIAARSPQPRKFTPPPEAPEFFLPRQLMTYPIPSAERMY